MNKHTTKGCLRPILAALVLFVGLAQAQAANEVFIWCANETALDEAERQSWDTIIGWLRSSENPDISKIAGQLERDRVKFPAVVDQDVAVLRERLPKCKVAAAIFTNRLVRSGKFYLLKDGQEFRETPIEIPKAENRILAINPMSRPEVLVLCLRQVAGQFDPAEHQFILVTKSHGNKKMAMTPRLTVQAEETNREELLAVGAHELPDDQRPAWARRRLGITKDDYFTVLGQLGEELGMRFSLVFMESCDGVLDENVTVRPPKNILRLYMTGNHKTQSVNLDYATLLKPSNVPLSQVLDAALAPKFPTLIRSGFPYRLILYWLPLLAFVGWLVVRRRVKHQGELP